MCRWIYKIHFDCGCRINYKGLVLFPRACHKARKNFRGQDHRPGVKKALFCPLPRGRGPEAIKMRIHYMCRYHHKSSITGREAEQRAAREPIDYKTVTAVAKSGLFDSVFENNSRKRILIDGLGWEKGDLVARPKATFDLAVRSKEKFEMSGGLEAAKGNEKEVEAPEADDNGPPAASPPKQQPAKPRPKPKTGLFGGLFGSGQNHKKPGPAEKKVTIAETNYERVYPTKPLNEREKRAAAAEKRKQPVPTPNKSVKDKGKPPRRNEEDAERLAFRPGSNGRSRSPEDDRRSLRSNASKADSDGTRSYISDGSSIGEVPQMNFHS